MLITLISPDKISMAMFVDFYRSLYDGAAQVFETNNLYSEDVRDEFFLGLKRKLLEDEREGASYIIKFYMKPKNLENLTIRGVGRECERSSDVIIKFDMFSSHPELLKYRDDAAKEMVDRWIENINRMNREK